MPMMDMSEFLDDFATESMENLDGIEGVIMGLESGPADPDGVHRAFRAVHSVKGAAGFLGLSRVADLTHAMESTLDLIRSGDLAPDGDAVDTLLSGLDRLRRMLSNLEGSESMDVSDICDRLEGLFTDRLSPAVQEARQAPAALVDSDGRRVDFPVDRFRLDRIRADRCLYLITYDLNAISRIRPESPLALIDRLLAEGEIIDARLDVPQADLHTPLSDTSLIYEILYATAGDRLPCEGDGDELFRTIRRVIPDEAGDAPPRSAGEPTAITNYELRITNGKCAPEAESSGPQAESDKEAQDTRLSSIRVSEEKLDRLVDLVGELGTVQASLTGEAHSQGSGRLRQIAEKVERIAAELRSVTLDARMVPIRVAFTRFQRLVRDISRKHDKEVRLVTEGGATELDKKVIESLYDPLTHILRNSIDHGIETPVDRADLGKPSQGTIHLTAAHEGGNVIIRVTDDGAGIEPEAIRAAAVVAGLGARASSPATSGWGADDGKASKRELLDLLFQPGFTTSKTVTDLSGRGVGMDVVKRRIEALRGTVSLTSTPGAGTTVTLKIPMTMAIIDGLLVRIGGNLYVIPLFDVEECVFLKGPELKTAQRRRVMAFRGHHLAYVSLRTVLGIPGAHPPAEHVVVIESGEERVGFGVDRVVGLHQAVIKGLGRSYRGVDAFSGSTILGDGTVALILNIGYLALVAGTRPDAEPPGQKKGR